MENEFNLSPKAFKFLEELKLMLKMKLFPEDEFYDCTDELKEKGLIRVVHPKLLENGEVISQWKEVILL